MTCNFVDEINQIADNAYNARLSNIQISSLNKISSSQNMISNLNYFPNTEKNENNNCYICKHCYIFPLIKIIDYNTIMLKCKDELNEKITFYVMQLFFFLHCKFYNAELEFFIPIFIDFLK